MQYPNLFSPIGVGPYSLRNRIVHTATVTAYGAEGRPTQKLIDHHRARALGGAAMIVTELMPVHYTSIANPFLVNVFDEGNLSLLELWAESVESAGCRLVGQIGHVGRQQLWDPLVTPVSATSKPDPLSWTVPHQLDADEIKELVASFVTSSERLKRAGFTGIELHGAHGYLLTQFMSPFSNDRDDEYGGTREGRLKFVVDVITGIRDECGKDFLIGLKMPCDEGVVGGIDPVEAEKIVRYLLNLDSIDYFAFSQGNFTASLENHLPDMHFPPTPFLNIHRRMRDVCAGVPAMTMGRITTAEEAEQALVNGNGDLIGLSRTLLSDSAWGNKIREGRIKEIRPCISCNYCWGEVHSGRAISCIHNPELGSVSEHQWEPTQVSISERKRLVVVGGGVAGLEAAWIAGKRGHDVTLFSASSVLGGKALLESRLPGRDSLAQAIEYQKSQAITFGIKFELGEKVCLKRLAECDPENIIFATGARPIWPETLAEDSSACDIREFTATLLQDHEKQNGIAVIFDQDHTSFVYAAAELAVRYFDRVIIVTSKTTIASKINYISVIGVLRRLSRQGVEIISSSVPISLQNQSLWVRNVLNGNETEIHGVGSLAYATPRKVDDELLLRARAEGFNTVVVGDSKAPRGLAAAIHEGHKVGETI